MAMIFAVALLSIFILKPKIKINYCFFLIPFFVIYSFVGTIIYSKEIREWISLVLLCFSFFALICSFRVLKNKYLITSVISIALFCFTVFYLIYYRSDIFDFKGFFNGKNRLGEDFDNQNGVATYAVALFGVSLYSLLFWNSKFRYLFIASIITSLWVGITTGSRTFIIAAYAIALVMLFFKFSKHKVIYIVSVVVFTLLILFIFNAVFENRLLAAFQTLIGTSIKSDTATISRELYMDYGFLLGSRNLIFGYGVKGFGKYSGVGTYAHNNYAEVLCDFGVVGLVIFYLPLLIMTIRAIKDKKVDKAFIISFVVYYFIASFSNVLYYKKLYYVFLSLLFYMSFDEPYSLIIAKRVPNLNKILFTCDTMGSGGAERVISVLANQMSKEGMDVSIIGVADFRANDSFYKLSPGVRYISICKESRNRINPISRLVRIRKTISQLHPDVVISFLPNANIYTTFSLIGLKIPHITAERNNPLVDPKGKISRLLKKFSFMTSAGCVFQTNGAKNYFPNIVRKKSSIIKNPILLNSEPVERSSLRNKTVLAVGRLTEQKNYKCLLDAFSAFNIKQSNSYTLKIYGEGPLKKELVDYSKKIRVDDKVIFVGNNSNWHELEKCDAMYVLASNYEGMPNALAEAMALGIPCVSTDCPSGGPKELIQDKTNGLLSEVNNSTDLANKMIELIRTPTNLFYDNTRNMIDDFSPKNITHQWIAFILNLKMEIYE